MLYYAILYYTILYLFFLMALPMPPTPRPRRVRGNHPRMAGRPLGLHEAKRARHLLRGPGSAARGARHRRVLRRGPNALDLHRPPTPAALGMSKEARAHRGSLPHHGIGELDAFADHAPSARARRR